MKIVIPNEAKSELRNHIVVVKLISTEVEKSNKVVYRRKLAY